MNSLDNISPLKICDMFELCNPPEFSNNKAYSELFEQISLLPYDGDLSINLALLCATWWIEKGRFDDMSYLDYAYKKPYYSLDVSAQRYPNNVWRLVLSKNNNTIAYMFWTCRFDPKTSGYAPFRQVFIDILCNGDNRLIIGRPYEHTWQ